MRQKATSTKDNQPAGPNKAKEARSTSSDKDTNVISLILRDHEPLKELIKILKDDDLRKPDKESALEDFVVRLINHAKAEEQTLYVAMKDQKELRVRSYEGDAEHAIADQLVQEINATPDDDEWNAKVKVLAEMVEHHIEEEEGDMLPNVQKKISSEKLSALGRVYEDIKDELDLLKNVAGLKGTFSIAKKKGADLRQQTQ